MAKRLLPLRSAAFVALALTSVGCAGDDSESPDASQSVGDNGGAGGNAGAGGRARNARSGETGGRMGSGQAGSGQAGSDQAGRGQAGRGQAGAGGRDGGGQAGAGGEDGGGKAGAGGEGGSGRAGSGGEGGSAGSGGQGGGGAAGNAGQGGASGATGGDTCASATVVGALPYVAHGDTSAHTLDYGFGSGVCPGVFDPSGAGARDVVYAFTPSATGGYTIELTSYYDPVLYVVTDCGAITSATCLGASDALGTGKNEALTLQLTAGTTYFVIVDGYATDAGAYALVIEPSEAGKCADGQDNDGNGEADCDDDGCKTDPACTLAGDVCGNAVPATGALPITLTGDTSSMSDDYAYDASACPGSSASWGVTSKDAVYAFTPTQPGGYRFELAGAHAKVLYVVTDCAHITGATCLGAADAHFGAATERLDLVLAAGTTYYVIVDGAASAGEGAYELTIGKTEAGACEGGQDDDGDAKIDCADDDCKLDAACLPAGDVCGNAIPIGALPFTVAGDSSSFQPNYGYGDGACLGVAWGGWGGGQGTGSPDVVYAFTPAAAGDYTFGLTADFDATLYVVTDCAAIDATCIKADEVPGDGGESLTATLAAGATYYVIVDGHANTSASAGTYTLTITQ